MKKVLLSLCLGLLIVPNAHAVPSCGQSLMPAFTANQATQLCKTFGSAVSQSLIPNADNSYDVGSTTFGWKTGYFDTSVITPLVSHATSLALGIAGTAEATITDNTLTFSGAAASIVGGATSLTVGSAGSTIIKADADVSRLFTFDASSDTALTQTFGDAGTTAAQVLAISGSTADADDDSTTSLAGGGAVGATRGGDVSAYGNELATVGGGILASAGNVATANINLSIENASSAVKISDTTTGLLWSFTDAGALLQDATNGGTLIIPRAGTATKGVYLGAATSPSDVGSNALWITSDVDAVNQLALEQSDNDSNGNIVHFLKSRATDNTANTIVANGDAIARLRFLGADGVDFQEAARIQVAVDAVPGVGDMPGSIDFMVSPDGSATVASALKISNTKNIVFGGTLIGTGTATLGWTVKASGAGVACETACTTPCVFGQNATFGLESCATAVTGLCVCAGAS